jgi:peptidase M23-like protein/concanavalin A-like lectin/glucanase superfamily protein
MTMMKRLVVGVLAAAAGLSACGGEIDDPSFGLEGTESESIEERQSALQSNWPWPLPGTMNRDWVVNNYVDLDPNPNIVRDYMGGQRTYDSHAGIDIDVPSSRAMDANVPVRAVSAGQVVFLEEGQPDRNLSCDGFPPWNYVTVRSSDGYQVTYGHLKKDSVVVSVGQNVAVGATLAVVGSSGCSTQTHLHLETVDPNFLAVEPFQAGFWASPPPYESTLGFMDENVSDILQARKDFMDPRPNVTTFVQGSPFSIAAQTGGGREGNTIRAIVRRPNGSVFLDQTHGAGDSQGHWVYLWEQLLETNAQVGTWSYDILVNGAVVKTSTFGVVAGRSFFDDFSDDTADGWTTSGGSWSVYTDLDTITGDWEYRPLTQSSLTGVARARATSVTAFGDQVARARVLVENISGTTWSASVLGRVRDNSNFYQASLASTNGTTSVQIVRVSGGTSTVLASAPFSILFGRHYDVRLDAIGSTLRAFVNDVQVATATDTTHTTGTVGVATSNAKAKFGVVKISTPVTGAQNPPGQASNPSPATGAVVPLPVTLSFTAGAGATSHDVHFGTANPPPFIVNQTGTTFNPGTLQPSTQYFWRINERNSAGVTTGAVWQFTTAAGGAPLFSDNFESGNTSKWTLLSGSWSVVTDGSKVMRQATLTDNARAQTNSSAWTNQRVSARVKPTQFNGSDRFVAVLARVQNATNYYYATLRSSGKIELKKLVNGTSTTFASKTFTVSPNTWYTVRLEVIGNALSLYVNGTLQLSGTDSQFASGRAGLATFFASAVFDDVVVNP